MRKTPSHRKALSCRLVWNPKIGGYSTAVAKEPRFKDTSILLMSGLPPSHFQDFMSEFSQLKLGILEKPFSLETLRRKLANIQGTRKLSGQLETIDKNNGDAPLPGVVQTGN